MHARERIIRDRFAGQTCGHCGEVYPPDGVIVLARRPSAWMVMASCRHCQNHCIYVVSFHDSRHDISIQPSDISRLIPGSFPPPASPTASPSEPPVELPPLPSLITQADVDAIHRFLASFDGNFRALFARQRPGRADESAG
ncbi:MAG TPA: hypothetical protein VKQ30_25345 [Ktedonobacterales bacterium]|nr:hypothetical protein [Ktedonobacterales bacterium]